MSQAIIRQIGHVHKGIRVPKEIRQQAAVGSGRAVDLLSPKSSWGGLDLGKCLWYSPVMSHVKSFRAGGRLRRWTRIHQWSGYRTLILELLAKRHTVRLGYVRAGGGRALVPIEMLRHVDGESVVEWEHPDWRDALRKVVLGGTGDGKRPDAIADRGSAVFARLVALVSHCSVVRYEDGSVRRPGWFTVQTYGSSWLIKVKDPDACAQLTVTAAALDDALALADLMVSSPDAPWEHDPFLKPSAPRAKK